MNKTILITGASQGIGAALAIELAKKGYNIAINYNTNETKAEEIAVIARGVAPRQSSDFESKSRAPCFELLVLAMTIYFFLS